MNGLFGEPASTPESVRFPSATSTAPTLAPSDVSPSARGYGTRGLMTQAGHSSVVVDEELPLSVSGRLHGKPRIPSFCVPCARWGPRGRNHGGGHCLALNWRGEASLLCESSPHIYRHKPTGAIMASDKFRGKESGKERKRPVIASPASSFINHSSTIEEVFPVILSLLPIISCSCFCVASPVAVLLFIPRSAIFLSSFSPDSPPTSALCSTVPTSCNSLSPASDTQNGS